MGTTTTKKKKITRKMLEMKLKLKENKKNVKA